MTHTIKRRKLLAWLFVILWMVLIFYLSHQTGTASSHLSSNMMTFIINIGESVIPFDVDVSTFHHFVRKGAHFFAYFVLGILVINALANRLHVKWKNIILASTICVIYAISDEVHQLFIPGRSGEVKDVFIDSIGSFSGLIVYILVTKLIQHRRS